MMGFGLHDKDWVDPDPEPENKCEDCEYWYECPCGCGNGWCSWNGDFTDCKDGC